jgi:hypothetical protein
MGWLFLLFRYASIFYFKPYSLSIYQSFTSSHILDLTSSNASTALTNNFRIAENGRHLPQLHGHLQDFSWGERRRKYAHKPTFKPMNIQDRRAVT